MASNYIMPGDVLDHTAAAALTSGQVLLMGKRVGIVLTSAAIGEKATVRVRGVFTVSKKATDVLAQGDLLYWNATDSNLTSTASGNTLAGFAADPAGSGVTTVNISLNG